MYVVEPTTGGVRNVEVLPSANGEINDKDGASFLKREGRFFQGGVCSNSMQLMWKFKQVKLRIFHRKCPAIAHAAGHCSRRRVTAAVCWGSCIRRHRAVQENSRLENLPYRPGAHERATTA